MRPLVVSCLLAAALSGCAHAPKPTATQRKQGIVYVLPGIEGASPFNRNIVDGLDQGGVQCAIAVYDWTTWTGGLGWFWHLADEQRNHRQAARFARIINRYQKENPGRPVYIVAHSGGAWIALKAVELLAGDRTVDGVILLAGAISPDHDLSRALKRIRRGIWNFYSEADIGFLVVGTTLFGTSDRKHEPAAGAVGFRIPPGLSDRNATLYANRLIQVPYSDEMSRDGHHGTHGGWTAPGFVAHWLAPIVLDRPDPAPNSGVNQSSDPTESDATAPTNSKQVRPRR